MTTEARGLAPGRPRALAASDDRAETRVDVPADGAGADLARACAEDPAAGFSALFDEFGPRVMGLAVNVLGNRQDAEDVCQDVFLQVHRKLADYDPARSLSTWVLTIAYRRCLDAAKKRRRFLRFIDRAKPAVREEALRSPDDPGAGGPLPSALLEGLSPRERTALCLWANEGYDSAAIAAVLGCAASTSRVYLFNARRKLKARLEKSHGEASLV